MTSLIRTIEILEDAVRLLDQRKLPTSEEYVTCRTAEDIAEAIRTMVVRGAPAIGVKAAAGIALGVRQVSNEDDNDITSVLSPSADSWRKPVPPQHGFLPTKPSPFCKAPA